MSFWRKLLSLLPSHRAAQERDMQEELESLKTMVGKNELGNLTLVAEDARAVWRWSWLDTCWSDIRFSLRTLAHSPGFAITSVLVLSVGIGLNLTFFQLINVVFLKPLPIRNPESLVRLQILEGSGVFDNDTAQFIASHNNAFSAVLTQARTLEGREIVWERNVTDPLRAHFVSANWFEELGVRALRGELFSATSAISTPVAVISERYWETRLQRDPAIVGTSVLLNHRPVTIVGIVPLNRGVLGGSSPQIWIPIEQKGYIQSGLHADEGPDLGVAVYGRLRPGLSLNAARASLKPALDEIARQSPQRFSNRNTVELYPASNHFRSPNSKNRMWAIIGICGSFTMLILLITCANLANLVLSRAAGRMQELSVRAALGASRSRVLRHLVSETAILSTLASAGALFLAHAGTRIFVAYAEEDLVPRDLALDWRTMAAAVVATILTTALVGLLPAWNIGKRDLATAMRDGGQQTSASLTRMRQRQVLLAAQVAGGCLLIVVAGLLLRSLQQVLVSPGFDYENVIVARQQVLSGDEERSYWVNLRQTLAETPGIESVAIVSRVPFQSLLRVDRLESQHSVKFTLTRVEPDFFRVMHMPFLAGRTFDALATGDSPVVVSKSLAVQLYGTSGVAGKRLAEIGTIVGVVDDVRLSSTDSMDFPQVYAPLQNKDYNALLVRARTSADAARLVPTLAQIMQDRGAGVPKVRLLETELEAQIRPMQILSALLSSLAGLALGVACMGIFGVVSYNVAVRRKEISIRMALGARRGSVILLMMQQLVWPVALAIVAGLLGGVIVGRIFESNGGPFSPPDTPVMTLVVLVILAAVAVACIVPTLRALRRADTRVLSS
jgi:predicted permease